MPSFGKITKLSRAYFYALFVELFLFFVASGVNQLLKSKRISHKEISSLIHLHPVSVHQHMKKLKEAELVEYHYLPHEYTITLNDNATHFLNSFLPQSHSNT